VATRVGWASGGPVGAQVSRRSGGPDMVPVLVWERPIVQAYTRPVRHAIRRSADADDADARPGRPRNRLSAGPRADAVAVPRPDGGPGPAARPRRGGVLLRRALRRPLRPPRLLPFAAVRGAGRPGLRAAVGGPAGRAVVAAVAELRRGGRRPPV